MNRSRPGQVPRNQVLVGDARQRLAELPDASVDCVITSPPYFGLRDYGHQAQLGLEVDVTAWVANLRQVCRELARILKPTGSLWLNVGDGYSAHLREGANVKSLLLGPARLALALAEDDWTLRNQVIWHKPNGMPHSVQDRLSNHHEVLLFLVRQRRYYFNLNAIRDTSTRAAGPRSTSPFGGYPPSEAAPHGRSVNRNHGLAGKTTHPLGKNPGDVWRVATASYRGAHFATFPIELVRRPLLATCPQAVCVSCGQPWQQAAHVIRGRKLATGRLRAICTCRAPSRPGIVLDPFMGAGTVALAAEQYGRDWIGIELNPGYAALAEQRLTTWRASRGRAS